MLICDLHCDLPDKVIDGETIAANNCHWSEDKLKKEHTYVQVFASYVDKYKFDDPFDRVNSMILNFKKQLEKTNIKLVTDKKSFENNINEGENSAILGIEGGEALGGKIERVKYFYNLGVRFMTLTWNHTNQLGESNVPWGNRGPLTEFGKAVVKEMNNVGMAVDVSHLSDAGFWDAIEISEKPIVATHSNSRAVCDFFRNISDEQFVAIKDCDGLVGINYVPDFLESNGSATISSVIKHIEHFMALGGENAVCLGGDFDGVDALPKGMTGINDVDKIASELAKLNYSDAIIAKIMGENVKNYIKSTF